VVTERPAAPPSAPEPAPAPVAAAVPGGRRTGLVAVSVLAVLLGGAAIAWFTRAPDRQAPDVVGLPYEQAVTRLTAMAVSAERRDRQSSSDTPGSIVAQNPPPGTVLTPGGTVTLTVAVPMPAVLTAADTTAAEPAPAAVEVLAAIPDLRGRTTEEARVLLADAGLGVGAMTDVASNDAPLGTVVDQAPAAAQAVAKGSPVQITVVSRRTTPEVAGLTLQQAQDVLTKLGLQQRVQRVRAERRAADNRVVQQAPAVGSEIAAGGEVTVTVAVVTPKTVNGGDMLRTTNGTRCNQVCREIGLEWNKVWSGTRNTCTCDF
jgi:beta-lactam-binding protein with PASTA domain